MLILRKYFEIFEICLVKDFVAFILLTSVFSVDCIFWLIFLTSMQEGQESARLKRFDRNCGNKTGRSLDVSHAATGFISAGALTSDWVIIELP